MKGSDTVSSYFGSKLIMQKVYRHYLQMFKEAHSGNTFYLPVKLHAAHKHQQYTHLEKKTTAFWLKLAGGIKPV